jgi:hypothetical protein
MAVVSGVEFNNSAYQAPVREHDFLRGYMAFANTLPVHKFSDYSSVDMSYGQAPAHTPRADKQWGIPADKFNPDLAEAVSKFQNMDKSIVSASAAFAGQAKAQTSLHIG